MPLWLVRMIGIDDDRENVESWEVNAPTEAEAIREVTALSSSRGHRVEAKLLEHEDAGRLGPGQAVRLE
jgi:hypothetical protein